MTPESGFSFYNPTELLKCHADIYMIIGERSNGKTYGVNRYAMHKYAAGLGGMAVVRRWEVDLKGQNQKELFDGIVLNNEVSQMTNGVWTNVYNYGNRWNFSRYTEKGKRIIDSNPFGYAFWLSGAEHFKSLSFPTISTFVFDEALTRGRYLANEYKAFSSILSTVVRYRDDVEVFLIGNTVNKYCPYFEEFGIYDLESMKPGDIREYVYNEEHGWKIAVQFSDAISEEGKPSDKYFAFKNPTNLMITKGVWETDMYPHLPRKFVPREVQFRFYVVFKRNILECEVISGDDDIFLFVHKKTSELQYGPEDLIFTTEEYSSKPGIRRRIDKPVDRIGQKVYSFFQSDKVFYQSNDIGEIMRNYLMWCKTEA